MTGNLELSDRLYQQFDEILTDLQKRTEAECVLLIDISGQLISKKGLLQQGDPTQVAALAAGDLAAMNELSKQIGEENPHGSFLHEGEEKSLYLFSVSSGLILIVVFRNDRPVGLMRILVRRAAERLRPLGDEFEELMGQTTLTPPEDFSDGLSAELTKAFLDE